MNTDELKQQRTSSLEKKQETYRIYDYMKEHTAFFIACVSGFVAVISFALSLIAFAYEQLQLRVWDVDIQLVNLATRGKSYYFVFSNFIYCIAFTLLFDGFEHLFQRHLHNIVPVRYLKELQKIISKLAKIQKRDVSRLRRKKRWERFFSSNKLEAKEELAMLDSMNQKLNILKARRASSATSIRHTWWQVTKFLLPGLFLGSVLLLSLILFLFCLTGQLILQYVLVVWLLLIILLCVLSALLVKLKEPLYSSKNIKQKAMDAVHQQVFQNIPLEEYAVPEIPPMMPKHFFGDSNLKNLLYPFLGGFLSLFLLMVSSGAIPTTQKSFWMYTGGQQSYAVVYHDANTCILKEAKVDGDVLTINTSNQLILDGKSIETHKATFSKVIRISK